MEIKSSCHRPVSDSGKKRTETHDQAIDQIRHLLERFNDRLTLGNLRLAERYLKAELTVVVHFRISFVDVELVACFQRPHSICRIEEKADLGNRASHFWGRFGHSLFEHSVSVR